MSLIEVMVSVGLFGVVLGVLFFMVQKGLGAWRTIDSQYDAHTQLNRAETFLKRDLKRTRFSEVRTTTIAGPPAAIQGDAIWFLSAQDPDPNSDEFIRTPFTGQPVWQTNVVYYLRQPSNHDTLFGQSCGGADAGGGYDAGCPHKFLIRLEVDNTAQAPLDDRTNPEQLLNSGQINGLCLASNGYDTSNLTTPASVISAQIVANRLLFFRTTVGVPASPGTMPAVRVELKSLQVAEARREITIGSTNLAGSRFTLEREMRVLPQNLPLP